VAVAILVDVELNIVRLLHTSSWHRDVYPIPDMSGIVGIVALVSQGYWGFGVQDFNLRDGHW